MSKITLILALLVSSAALADDGWEFGVAASYGICELHPAPNAYLNRLPSPRSNRPLAASLAASHGRWGLAASYAPRYELVGEVGKIMDVALVGRAAPLYRENYAVYAEAGVAVSRSRAPMAFLFDVAGPVYDWTPVVGAGASWRPWRWLAADAGVSYRERLQVVNFAEFDPYYGTVKSPAVGFRAEVTYYPWRWLGVGPSAEYIAYGPYDYYLYAQTNRNDGWKTADETYVLATVRFVFP